MAAASCIALHVLLGDGRRARHRVVLARINAKCVHGPHNLFEHQLHHVLEGMHHRGRLVCLDNDQIELLVVVDAVALRLLSCAPAAVPCLGDDADDLRVLDVNEPARHAVDAVHRHHHLGRLRSRQRQRARCTATSSEMMKPSNAEMRRTSFFLCLAFLTLGSLCDAVSTTCDSRSQTT